MTPEEGEFYGFVFQDTDSAKWLETVAYSLILSPDPELERTADDRSISDSANSFQSDSKSLKLIIKGIFILFQGERNAVLLLVISGRCLLLTLW